MRATLSYCIATIGLMGRDIEETGSTTSGIRMAGASLFERETYDPQELTFDHARKVFATACLAWDEGNLEAMGIFAHGSATGVGLLISDQCPYTMRAAVFDGVDKTKPIAGERFSGSVLDQLTQALAFVNAHNDAEPGWPGDAVREGLVNAVLHRDYALHGPTVVSLFDDRLEIVSMGALPGGMGYDDLTNGACNARNPILADLFEALGLSRNEGSGLSRVMSAYEGRERGAQVRLATSSFGLILPRGAEDAHPLRDAGTGDPERGIPGGIDTKRYAFVPGRRPVTHDPRLFLAGMRVIGVDPLAEAMGWPLQLPLAPAERVDLVPRGADETLEEATLHLLAAHGVPLSRDFIQQTFDLTKGRARALLNGMVEDGSIVRVGRSRATKYALAGA